MVCTGAPTCYAVCFAVAAVSTQPVMLMFLSHSVLYNSCFVFFVAMEQLHQLCPCLLLACCSEIGQAVIGTSNTENKRIPIGPFF